MRAMREVNKTLAGVSHTSSFSTTEVAGAHEWRTFSPIDPRMREGVFGGSGGRVGPSFSEKGRTLPFNRVIQHLQLWVNTLSSFLDDYFSIPLEVFLILAPFVVGFFKVFWPSLLGYFLSWRANLRQCVQRDTVAVSMARYRYPGSMGNDRNALLQHAMFLYLTRVIWSKRPLPSTVWRNKAASFLLVDPLRSRVYENTFSPFAISDSDSDAEDEEAGKGAVEEDVAAALLTRSKRLLQRLVLIKLPIYPFWVPIGVNDIEISYKRETVKVEEDSAVRRTVSLRAYGKDADQRIEEWVHRALDYFIHSIPSSRSKRTRYFFELQPSFDAVGGVVGGGGKRGEGGSSSSSPLLFKRYALADDVPLNTVFFPERERVWRLIDQFLLRQGRFAIEGFPYKLGFLLYGPPGTGKTAFVKALAAYTGRHVVSIPLHLIQTNQQLYDIFLVRNFTCVGDSNETLPLEEIIFYMEDTEALNQVIWARQRKRCVWMRKPARLTSSLSSSKEGEKDKTCRMVPFGSGKNEEEEKKEGGGRRVDYDHEARCQEEDQEVLGIEMKMKKGERNEKEAKDEKVEADEEDKEEGSTSRSENELEPHSEEYTRVIVELPEKSQMDKESFAPWRGVDGMSSVFQHHGSHSSEDERRMCSPWGCLYGNNSNNYHHISTSNQEMQVPFHSSMDNNNSTSPSPSINISAAPPFRNSTGYMTGGSGDGTYCRTVPPPGLKRSIFSMMDTAMDKLDLSGILNVLDGVVDTPSRILVMSTQHPERIDPALIRPGRMSVKIRMDYIQFDALAGMAGLHFGDVPPSSQEESAITKKLEEMEKSLQIYLRDENKNEMKKKSGSKVKRKKDDWNNDVIQRESAVSQEGEDENNTLTSSQALQTCNEQQSKTTGDGLPFPSSSPLQKTLGVKKRGEEGHHSPQSFSHSPDLVGSLNSFKGRRGERTHIPFEMAMAHLPLRQLSEEQRQRLSETIMAFEEEDKNIRKKNSLQEGKSSTVRSHNRNKEDGLGYNFHIPPSAIRMICAEQDTFNGFLEGLAALIRREREY